MLLCKLVDLVVKVFILFWIFDIVFVLSLFGDFWVNGELILFLMVFILCFLILFGVVFLVVEIFFLLFFGNEDFIIFILMGWLIGCWGGNGWCGGYVCWCRGYGGSCIFGGSLIKVIDRDGGIGIFDICR